MNSSNWQKQIKDALRDQNQFPIDQRSSKYSSMIPKELLSKIKESNFSGALAKQFIPHKDEDDERIQSSGFDDPIGDQIHQKAGPLIHRYKTRALFTPTTVCPIHCRYCFRKNELNNAGVFRPDFDSTISYLKEHPEIYEIIFTGGDPLVLSNEKIEFYLSEFSKIESIQAIRFHTRTPVIIPSRIDANFIKILKYFQSKFNFFSMAIHINHTDEWSGPFEQAIALLHETGITLLSQTVLLKDVNDDSDQLVNLFKKLAMVKVRPYYLHHPDLVKGAMHFYLPIEEGRKIYANLRQELPGWLIPEYIIDIPGGEGKVSAFNPENVTFSGNLLSKDMKKIAYPYLSAPFTANNISH